MQRHAKSPGHLRNATFPCPQLSSPVAPNGPFVFPTEEVSTRTSESPMETLPDFTGDVNEQDMDSVGLDPEDFHQQMENDLATTQAITLTPNSETRLATSPQAGSPFPKNRSSGNEWLANVLHEKKRATTQEINLAFSHPELLGMRNFWMAEHASGEGRCGGGICYLAARAFQQAKDSQLDTEPDRFPDYEEALWHFNCLLQFQSQNEKQRMRQSRLHGSLADHLPSESLFKRTFIPCHSQLGRFYGGTGMHSMWNNLPTPKAKLVGGVAFVSPIASIAFLMANGIPIDDMSVSAEEEQEAMDPTARVHSGCRKAAEWKNDIRKGHCGKAPIHPTVILLSLSDSYTTGQMVLVLAR